MSKRSFRLSDSKADPKRDVDDEVAFHLEMRVRELVEQGMSPDDARRQATAAFGDVQAIRAELREQRAARNEERRRRDWWSGLRLDAAYAMRFLRHNAAFSIASIATLALGIGATMAVYTVVNGVLIRPLPYKDPTRLSLVWMTTPSMRGANLPVSSGFYGDLAREARSFESLAAFRSWPYALTGANGENESVSGARVSPSLFDVLGVRPLLGQAFGADAAVPGGPRVAMISYGLWQRRFGEDPAIVGKQVTLSGEPFTVTGIMPPGFAFPRGAEMPSGLQFGLRTDVWTPLVFDSTDLQNYGTQNISAIGKRNASVSLEQAQAEATAIMKRFLVANSWRVELDYHVVPMQEQASQGVRRGLLILMGAVACLLLIAGANVTSLLVARARGRQRELAVRAALGAGRARIARQLITENVVLAVAGGLVGIGLSYVGTKAMLALVPGSMPRSDDIGLDWRVLSVAAGVALATGAIFGIASASTVKWNGLALELHAGGTRATSDSSRRLGRQLLVTMEVALSLMLLIGAALLTRSFMRLQQVDAGFHPENVLVANVRMPSAGRFNPTADGPVWAATLNAATGRLAGAAGIVSAGAVSSLPLSGAVEGGGLLIPGRAPDPPGQGPHAQTNVVSGEYFRTARIAVVAGRAFDASDDAPGAGSIIVNREFVRTYLGTDADAVGRNVIPRFTFTRGKEHRIVGVVDNVKQMGLDEAPTPQVYVPQSQLPYPGLTLVLRTAGDPLAAIPTLRRELRAVDMRLTVNAIQTFQDVFDESLGRQRFNMTLIAVFAGCALVLALVGLYGVIALIVSQRHREIGVRLALGAQPRDVVRMVVLEGSRVALVGVALGVVGALGLTRVLRSMLYDVSPTDAATFVGAAAIVVVVSTAAAFAPARRASRVEPTVTLKAD